MRDPKYMHSSERRRLGIGSRSMTGLLPKLTQEQRAKAEALTVAMHADARAALAGHPAKWNAAEWAEFDAKPPPE